MCKIRMSAAAGGGGGGAAAGGANRVEVILLAEEHGAPMCAMRNMMVLNQHLAGLARRMASPAAVLRSVLLFSEGRDINPCYTALKIPSHIIMKEHGAEQTKIEQIDKFLLLLELLHLSALNHPLGRDPTGAEINMDWFINNAQKDGFNPMLQAIPGGLDRYRRLVRMSLEHNRAEYNAALTDLINDILEHYLTGADDGAMREMVENVRDVPTAERLAVLKQIFTRLRELRDASVIDRISARVAADPEIKVIFLIFGAAHYDNMARLIGESPNLRLSSSSNRTYRGGKRKSRRRARHRSKSRRRRN